MDGSAQDRRLDERPASQRPRQRLALEPLEARPERDVRRRRVLRLDAAHPLDRPRQRQARALEQQLSRQHRTVELALREDSLRVRHGRQATVPAVDLVPEPIDRYAADHTTPPEPLLAALAEETRRTLQSPQMLTGTVEGRFLEVLVY